MEMAFENIGGAIVMLKNRKCPGKSQVYLEGWSLYRRVYYLLMRYVC